MEKYLSEEELLAQSPNLNHLDQRSFQGVNRFFALAFEDDAQRTSNKRYYLPNVETKDYNVMIDGKNVFDQPVENDKIAHENDQGQGDDYTSGCLLDYAYFRDNYRMIAIDLSKQQALDANPRAIQQVSFNTDLVRANNIRKCFILEEAKETVLDFSHGTVKVLWICYGII